MGGGGEVVGGRGIPDASVGATPTHKTAKDSTPRGLGTTEWGETEGGYSAADSTPHPW